VTLDLGAMDSGTLDAVWECERTFHDALAQELVPAELSDWGSSGFDAALTRMAGDVRGLSVLDAGCGQGDLTLHLLRAGAHVTAVDLSPGMIEVVERRAGALGDAAERLSTVAAPLERSGLAAESFDLILGRWVLHHLDLPTMGPELRRLLRPGGRAFFIETSGENPMLSIARRRLAGRFGIPRFGTEDEHPLVRADFDSLSGSFRAIRLHYPEFVFFWLFDRQVLKYRSRFASTMLYRMDHGVWRLLPSMRRFSYYMIVELAA
jgi:SAM-dependent methyltransferase